MTSEHSGEAEESAYKGKWWVEDLTAEEERLFPEKYYDQLPGASLPKGIVVKDDVPVEMSDGLKLAANVFRPDRDGEFPVIVAFTPYSKDFYGQHAALGVSDHTAFEAPDPGFWVPHGYAVVLIDRRGTGRSPSGGTGGAYDFHDGIEWAAAQEWSDGNVGTLGHSALAIFQWEVAAMEDPPSSLKAIIPWGGYTIQERDLSRPGGIPETSFSASNGENIPLWQEDFEPEERPPLPSILSEEHGGVAETADLSNITVPLLLGSTWADTEYHLRGNLRAWQCVSTPDDHKWLYTYSQRKWKGMYVPAEPRDMQRKFFDHFLRGKESGILTVPRVRLAVRDTLFDETIRYEDDWPIPRTQYTKLYLDARDDSMSAEKPDAEAVATYDSEADDGSVVFDITFQEDTELSGHSALKLWASPEDARDMDIFVTLRKLNADGHEVRFKSEVAPGRQPVDQGWLRLSKRELDEDRSEPWLPVQKSVAAGEPEQAIEPGDVVPAHVQIVGSSTRFKAGETLRLEIGGTHGVEDNLLSTYDDLVNEGAHSVHTGGERASYLQVPVVPEEETTDLFTFEPRQYVNSEQGIGDENIVRTSTILADKDQG